MNAISPHGEKFAVSHPMHCPKGCFTHITHNKIRLNGQIDEWGNYPSNRTLKKCFGKKYTVGEDDAYQDT